MTSSRGQTLVLFALTMLLISLMALMTIGIGVRVHERQEQQVIADASAYSEAVVTARTFNAISSMNRALIAEMSAVAAAQSLMSWAGFYHGCLNQARDMLDVMRATNNCSDVVFQQAHDRIMNEDRRLIDIWEPVWGNYPDPLGYPMQGYDPDSANYVRDTLYAGASIQLASDQEALYATMRTLIGTAAGSPIADQIALGGAAGSPSHNELYAPPQVVTIAARDAAVIDGQTKPKQMVRATMATRGVEKFLSSREKSLTDIYSAGDYVGTRITAVMNPSPLVANVIDYGTSYFGDRGPQPDSGPMELIGLGEAGYDINWPVWMSWQDLANDAMTLRYRGAWAQDNGRFYFTWQPGYAFGTCSLYDPPWTSFGYLVATGPTDTFDNHMWQRGEVAPGEGIFDYRELNDPRVIDPPDVRHRFRITPPGAPPPTIWPVFVDFQDARLNEPAADHKMYGVPKSVVPIIRDYSRRANKDPWELDFNFKFSTTAQTSNLTTTRMDAAAANDFSKSVAIGTGLTYYHRGNNHAQEPPNFLNPFWRATLVASDVNETYAQRGQSIIDTLTSLPISTTTQVSALNQLKAAGFEAIP